jgi:cyclase
MLNRPRVIPVLTILNSNLVKTVKFKNPIYLGDPINAVKIFNEKKVDELCILDIGASKNKTSINYNLLQSIAAQAFMPLSYGGGIRCISEIKSLFKLGFEKVILNSSVASNPSLIEEASKFAGNQSIVLGVDVKKSIAGKYTVYTHSGRSKISQSIEDYIKNRVNKGIGEVFINSIDNEGKMNGYDLNLIRKVTELVDVPVVACGGAGHIQDIRLVLEEGKANAAAAGSLFVYYGKNKAVLINFPSDNDFFDIGVFNN